jgi:hydrogenase-4 component B
VRFAGFNYLVSTHVGLIFLVAAFMILYTRTSAWDLGGFGRWLSTHPGPDRDLVFVLLVASFGLKSAFFPFHSWLPRAHAAAPAHVSALMSGVIHKAGLYALVRFLLLIGRPDEWMGWFLIGFSALSAVIGALHTVGQRDLKRLLGYSSTEHVGIAGIGFGVGCLGLAWGDAPLVAVGFAGGLLHVLNHAFFKCQLFYAAGAVYQSTHTVDLERLGGLSKLMPWTSLAFLLGGVAMAALPPLNGFASEFVLYGGLFTNGPATVGAKVALYACGATLAFVGAISALSIVRAFGVAFLGRPRDPGILAPVEVSHWMRWPMAAHALGVCVLGMLPGIGFLLVRVPASLALGALPGADGDAFAPVADALARVGLISGGGVLAVGGLLWWRLRTRVPRGAAGSHAAGRTGPTWGCGYEVVGPRMQYTASSFSADIQARFAGVLLTLRRQKAPLGYFPTDAYVVTDCVDAVERRLLAVVKRGDASAGDIARHLREDDPRVAFAAALVAVVAISGLVVLAGGGLP